MARAKIENERKDQILAAFETCVIRDGLAKTTLQKVADEVGLPRSLVRYFVGNRNSMVELLIARMIERAEVNLVKANANGRADTLEDVLDILFSKTFADETSNSVVGELWYLAGRDVVIRKRLSDLYGRITTLIVETMADQDVGQDRKEREAVAFALLSLAYGEASFKSLNLQKSKVITTRKLADALVAELQNTAVK